MNESVKGPSQVVRTGHVWEGRIAQNNMPSVLFEHISSASACRGHAGWSDSFNVKGAGATFQPTVAFQGGCSVLNVKAQSLNPNVVFQPNRIFFPMGQGQGGGGGVPRRLKRVARDLEWRLWRFNSDWRVNKVVV